MTTWTPTAAVPEPPPADPSADPPPTLIASAQRALRLLEAASRYPAGAPAKQLARDTGLALGTTYHLLRTLVHDRYLERRAGIYRTGPAVSGLCARGQDRDPDREESPETAGRDRLAQLFGGLARELSAAVYFARYKGGEVQLLAAVPAPGAPVVTTGNFEIGAHAHATGKTLLALMSAEERRAYLARRPMVALTPYTVLDPARLPLLPRQGPQRAAPITQYQEYAMGVAGAAVPIVAGSAIAAVSLSLPMSQAHRLPQAAAQLRTRVGDEFAAAVFGLR